LEKEEGKPALIIVDYLQLMRSGRNLDNRVNEVSEIARGLKTMAKEMKVPVIALSQLSREVEKRPNKRPMLSDLRESGSIEAEADMVTFIYRDKYYEDKTLGENEVNPMDTEVAEVIISKHRNGPTGTVLLGFQPAFTKFTLLDEFSKTDYLRTKRRSGAEE
ncbi:MAG: DnaB-like helicase C-terminal domain-containing protein, partial [Fimbriimonadaceae bacterium]|nr:DnaB-like helicase C-terminal domain-containing protein [Fimbriimonadaceae bacterium]